MKELHEITGKGKMGECDIYPEYSVQLVEIKDNIRLTKNGSDCLVNDIESRKLNLLPNEELLLIENLRRCNSCKNIFTEKAIFYSEVECKRCHERKTKFNR